MMFFSLNKFLSIFTFLVVSVSSFAQESKKPKPHRLGFAIGINKINKEILKEAKEAGVDYIEISLPGFMDVKTHQLSFTSKEIKKQFEEIKAMANNAGIKVWSIHMPYGKEMDISIVNEVVRKKVVESPKDIIKQLVILQPEIILFHPSWYLEINEREKRKRQFIKSATSLQASVDKINATMVIENMLGPKLMANKERERPLNRTVEEMVEIMNKLPKDIYAAVDMNHIKNPEILVKALGSRLKSVHIADGDGLHEQHAFPCSGEGKNNWTKILAALYEVGYNGVFMYECKMPSVQALKTCYDTIYNNYLNSNKKL